VAEGRKLTAILACDIKNRVDGKAEATLPGKTLAGPGSRPDIGKAVSEEMKS
jgi:hypothetical protein